MNSSEAFKLGLDALARRSLSSADLKKKLFEKGCPPEAADEALARLVELRYLDDADFAQRRAQQLAGRGYGDYAINERLKQHGLTADLRAEALRSIAETEPERIKRVIEKKPAAKRDKLIRFLAARGFGMEAIFETLNGEDDEGI